MKSRRSLSIRRRPKSRKTRAKPKRVTHRRKSQCASHGGSQGVSIRDLPPGKKGAMIRVMKEAAKERTDERKDTKALNYLSNSYPVAYFDGEDKFSLGDSFMA